MVLLIMLFAVLYLLLHRKRMGLVLLSSVFLFSVPVLADYNVTFHAGDGTFEDGTTENVATYGPVPIKNYSHTANINDEGIQNGKYENSLRTKDVVQIQGATSLHVKVTYGTETNWDLLYIFAGQYTGSVTSNMDQSTGYLYKLTGNGIVEYDIPGNTVTFAFYSDSVSADYGYYAIVTSENYVEDVIKNGIYKEPQHPNTDYEFIGWFDENDNEIDIDTISEDAECFAKYKYIYDYDGIDWRYNSDTGELKLGKGETQVLEAKERSKKDYPWDSFRSEIKKVTTDGNLTMNGCLKEMFTDCTSLESADISWDMTGVTDTSQMFENCISLSEITIGEHASILNSGIRGSRWEKEGNGITSAELMESGNGTYHLVPCYAVLYDDGSLIIQNSDITDERTVIKMWKQVDVKRVKNETEVPWYEYRNQIKNVKIDTICVPYNVDYWFYSMINCTKLDLTYLDTRKNNKMKNMFSKSENIKEITLGETFSFTGEAEDSNQAILPGDYYKKDNIRISSKELKNNYSSAMAGTYIRDDYWAILYDDGEMVFQYGDEPDGRTVTGMWSGFETPKFENTSSVPWYDKVNLVKKITIKDEIEPLFTKYWFYGMKNCMEMDLDKLNTINTIELQYMFSECNTLYKVTLGEQFSFKGTSLYDDRFAILPDTVWQKEGSDPIKNIDLCNTYNSSMTGTYIRHGIRVILYDNGELIFQNSFDFESENIVKQWMCPELLNDKSEWATNYADSIKKVIVKDEMSPSSTAYWFCGLTNCTQIDVSKLDTSNVTSMNHMFAACSHITDLDLSNFNTSNVTRMDYMFASCYSLVSLDISNFDTSKVTVIYYMFSDSKQLRKIKLGRSFSFKGKNISNTNYKALLPGYKWKNGDTILTSAELRDTYTADMAGTYNRYDACAILYEDNEMVFQIGFDTDGRDVKEQWMIDEKATYPYDSRVLWDDYRTQVVKVTVKDDIFPVSTAYWFKNFTNCTQMDLAKLNTSNTTDMRGMFSYCNALSKVTLGENFSFKGKNITNTSSMTILPAYKWEKDGTVITNTELLYTYTADMAGTYNRFNSTINVILYDDNELVFQNNDHTDGRNIKNQWQIEENETNTPWSDYKEQITKVTIKDDIYPVSTTNWFSNFTNCTQMDLAKLNTSNTTEMRYMFNNCYSLTTLDVSNFNTSKVTNMEGMFQYCSGITSLDLSNFDTSKATYMNSMFYNMESMNAITISDPNFFKGNTSSTSYRAVLPGSSWENNNIFYTPTDLQNADSIATGTYIRHMMSAILYSNGELVIQNHRNYEPTSASISGRWLDFSDKSYTKSNIPWNSYLTNIKKVTIKDPIYPKYLANWFNGCTNCTEMDLSKLDTSNTVSMNGMFTNCSNLQKVQLGADFSFSGNNITSESDKALLPGSYWKKDERISSADLRDHYTAEMAGIYIRNDTENTFDENAEFVAILYSTGELKFMNMENADLTDSNIVQAWTGFETAIYTSSSQVPWYNMRNLVKNVIFEDEISPTAISYWFYEMIFCEEFDLSKLNTSNVTKMHYTFAYCSELQTLDISGFNTENTTDMGGIFFKCNKLKEIILGPDFRFKGNGITNLNYMCELPNTYWKNENGQRFSCNDLRDTYTGSMSGKYFLDDVYAILYEDGELIFQKGYEGDGRKPLGIWTEVETKTYSNAPWYSLNSTKIKKVTVKDSFSPASLGNWFYGLKNCQTMDLAKLDTSKATSMYRLFYNCDSLTSLDLSNFDTSNATDMSYMLSECKNLSEIKLGENFSFKGKNITNTNNMAILPHSKWKKDDTFYSSAELQDIYTSNMAGTYYKFQINVILYEDNELVFQIGNDTDGRNVKEQWLFSENTIYSVVADVLWKDYREEITKVTVKDEFAPVSTALWFYDFMACTQMDLTKLDISNVTDMSYMFEYCTNLTNLDVTGFNTSKVTNMSYMFYNCNSLTSLDLSNFDTSKVTNMGYMFYNCNSLISLNISSFNTQKVSNMTYMFSACKSLTSLNVSNFNTSNVGDMSDMFAGCNSLISLDLSNFDTSHVANMRYMFSGCSSFNSLDVSNFSTSAVSDMHGMFYYCKNLTSLDLSNFKTSYVSDMTNMLIGCDRLEEIKIGQLFRFNGYYITDTSKKAKFPGYKWKKDDIVISSTQLRDTYTADMAGTYTRYDYYAILYDDYELVIQFQNKSDGRNIINEWCIDENVLQENNIPWNKYDTQIKKVTVKDEFAPVTAYNLFYNLSACTQMDLSKLNTSNVTNMHQMFCNCSSLTSLDLSNFDTSNVTDMYQMFCNCSSLTSLDLSNFDTSNVTDMYQMFYDCKNLISLDLSNFNTSKVRFMYFMFCGCNSLINLDLYSFTTQSLGNCNYMFGDCKSLETLDISNFSTESLSLSDANIFYQCNSLRSITVGEKFSLSRLMSSLKGKYWRHDNERILSSTLNNTSGFLMAGTYTRDDYWLIIYYNGKASLQNNDSLDEDTCLMKLQIDASTKISDYNSYIYSLVVRDRIDYDNMFFKDLTNCEMFDVTKLNISNSTDLSSMFSNCSSAKQILIDTFNTNHVTTMYQMFYNCSSLKNISLNSFDTSNVTNMYQMFCGCSSLEELLVDNLVTDKVTNMSSMFNGCSKLKSLNLSSFNTSKASVSSMFSNTGLTKITLGPDFSFKGNITNSSSWATLPGSNWRNIATGTSYTSTYLRNNYVASYAGTYVLDDMYAKLYTDGTLAIMPTSASSGSVKASWTLSGSQTNTSASSVSWNAYRNSVKKVVVGSIYPVDMSYWFMSMPNCTEIDLNLLNTSTTTKLKDMFTGNGVQQITIGKQFAFKGIATDPNEWAILPSGKWKSDKGTYSSAALQERPIAGVYIFDQGACAILYADGQLVIQGTTNGDGRDILATWKNIDETDQPWSSYQSDIKEIHVNRDAIPSAGWFKDLTNCKEIHAQKLNFTGELSHMFDGCTNLEELEADFTNTTATDTSYMFAGCGLEVIDVSGLSAPLTNAEGMFSDCPNLITVLMYDMDTRNANVKNLFDGSDIKEIEIGSNVRFTGIDEPAEIPGEYWKRTRVRSVNRISSNDLQNFDGTRGGTYERDDRYAYINGSTLVFTADEHEWTGFETTDSIPWDSSRSGITAVEFEADVHPITIAHWFENLAISEIDLSNLYPENTTDYTEAFKGSSIRSIELGGQPTLMPSVFENCELLTTITGLNTTNATDMSGLFRNCSSLSTLDLTNIKTDNATNLSGMFEGTGLTTLDLSDFDTSKATDMSAMFREAQVETLDISGFTTEQADVSNMFTGCHFSNVKLGDTFNFNGTGDATILPTPPKENGHNGKWTDGTNEYSPKALRALYDSTPTTTTWVWADDTNAYVEFDANGGTFLDGSTVKTVSSSNRYSYTSNMDSSGIPWSGYGNNVDTEDVITIPNADSLVVELTYETEDNDSLYIKENNTTYSGARHTETINIDGDTVTFVFHSDASIDNHFGYLAKVTGIKDGEPVQLTETNAPSEPIRPGYMFDGWNTMADGTGDTKEVVPFTAGNTTTVYAKWTKDDRVTLTVLHKKENLDGSWYTADTDSYKVWPDTETTPSTKTYTGFHTPDSQTITITEDSELEYQYEAEKYTIKFLSNGADGTMNDAVMKIPYVQPLPSCTYKKEGSIFMGWDLNGTTYSDRQVVRLGHDGDVVSLTAIWLDNDTPAVEVKNGEMSLKLRPGQTAVVPLSAHINYNIEETETEGWKSESKNTAGTIPAGKDEQATITNTRIVDPLTFKVHGSFIPADHETGKFLLSFDGDAVYELSAGDTMLFGEVLPFEVTMDGTADMGREYDKNAHIGGTKTTNGMETFEGISDRITVDAPATVIIKGTPMGAEAESTKTEESEQADIVFDLPAFTRPGTYHMTMRQVAGNDDRIIYDNQTVDITVTVTDDGKLTAEQDNVPVFKNSIKDVKLSITNTVTNTTKDSTFYFIVNATRDGEPINTNGFTDGKLRIGLKGNETKEIDIPYGVDYTVTQEDHPGFVLVSSERTNGKMVEDIEATFENTRVLSSEFDPYVITELIGGEGVMAFELRDKDGNVIDTAESTGGRVIFKPIPYTGEGEYTYYVTGLEGTDRVAYDTHTETIQVLVREGEGLEVTATYEKDDHASFVSRAIHDLVIKNTNNGPDNGFEYTLSLKNPDGTETNDTFTLKNNENKSYELLSETEWTITQTAKDGFSTTTNGIETNMATGTIMLDTEVQYNNNFAAEVYISVVDENNAPLSGVQVRVNSDHDEWMTDGTQHTTGGLVPGNYTIETTVPTGYEPVSNIFTVNDNGTIEGHADSTIILTVPYSLHDVPIRTVDERNQHIEAKVTAGETVINMTTADSKVSVKPGTYTATQDKVTGYECPAPIEFTVAIDGTITVNNETVTEIKLINTREEYTLTFTLNLEGNMADNTKMFGFTMETNDAGSISQETFELDNGSNKTFIMPYGATYKITPEQNDYTYNKNTVEGTMTGDRDESITATLNKGIDTGRATSTAGVLIVLISMMAILYMVNERKNRNN